MAGSKKKRNNLLTMFIPFVQGSTRSLDRSSPTRRRRTSADTKKRQRSPEPRYHPVKNRPSKVFRLYHSNILTQILFPFLIFSYLFQTAAKQRDGRPHLRLPIPRDPYRRLSSGQIEPFKKIHFRVLCRGKASKLVPNHNYALLNWHSSPFLTFVSGFRPHSGGRFLCPASPRRQRSHNNQTSTVGHGRTGKTQSLSIS